MKPRNATLLFQRHRRAQWLRPLWIFLAGLTLDLVLARAGAAPGWRFGVLGVAAVLAVVARFWPRSTLRETARDLDAKMGSHNRLEALAELVERTDPLAEALRAEAEVFLAEHRAPRSYTWFAGLALLVALLVVGVGNRDSWRARPVVAAKSAEAAKAPAVAPAATPVEVPPPPTPPASPAALRWIAPEAMITAAPKETVPLSLEADSGNGLRNLALHMTLNGEARAPVASEGKIAAGVQPVEVALALEPLEVQPYDVVTYFLRAEPIRSDAKASEPVGSAVSSSLQLVEIRALREEPMANVDEDEPASRVLDVVQQLKREQFGVLRDAFALGNELVPRADPSWPELMRMAETQQESLSEQASAAIPSVAAAGIPAGAAEALAQAGAEAQKAGADLARGDPAAATIPAGRALARLATAEKIVAKVARENRARLAAEAAARDAKDNEAELPAREDTPAGRLEKLAAAQKTLAEQLASRTAAEGVFKEQDGVAREIAKLAAERAFPPEINEALATAAAAARESANQLNESDPTAATEPATRAAQTLAEALANLEAAGRVRAVEELLAAQRALIRAATELELTSPEERAEAAKAAAERTAATQRELHAAARRQQRQGSAEAAQKLEELAKALAEAETKKALAEAARSEPGKAAASRKLTDLAQRAADAVGGFEDEQKTQERAREELRRVQANLERIARGSRPLLWIDPESEISADADETVELVAEATTDTGLTGLALHLTVNGEARPSLAVPGSVAAGVQEVTVSLALAPLKLRPEDIVSYVLSAERAGAAAGGKVATPKTISSPVQLIAIRGPERESAGGGGGETPEVIAEVRKLLAAQRDVVERTFVLSRRSASPAGAGGADLANLSRGLEADQRRVARDARGVRWEAVGVLPEGAMRLLREAEMEMGRAATELAQSAPAAAAPPAVRALAAIAKILRVKGGGGSPEMTDLYEKALAGSQQLPTAGGPAKVPPPPGPGASGRKIRDYPNLLSQRVGGLIRMAGELNARRDAKRGQVLTTGNPSEAPPAYRPAVADYFEALARDRATPAPRKP